MKAIRIHEFGGPEALILEDQPKPQAGQGEVLVRVHASSVNPVDYKIRNGGYLPADALPITLGRDMAGVIDEIGGSVEGLGLGDRVFALLDRDRGGHAEFVAVKAADCAAMPSRLDFIQAAAVPLAGLTAWQGLFDHGGLAAGQRVLIHGAAGGVGHLAVQFAKARGAVVFATCSKPDVQFVLGLGADTVIDYQNQRFEDHAGDIDLVFDLVGGETQDRSLAVLKAGGVLVSTLKAPDEAKTAALDIRGVHYRAKPAGAQLTEIARLIDAGQVMPNIVRVLPLDEAAEAERELEHDHVPGKIVLTVSAA